MVWALHGRRRLNSLLLGALVSGQVLLIGQQVRDASGRTRLSYWSGAVILPVQAAVQAGISTVGGLWGRYVWLVNAGQENRRLDAEADRLKVENHFLRQKLLQVGRSTELEAYAQRLDSAMLEATIVHRGPTRTASEIVLNKGSRHGLKQRMAVVAGDGIVGKVEAVYGSSSVALLISDARAGAGVLLGHSGAPGVLRGTGTECVVEFVAPSVRILVGEPVFTSGQDGIFPRGLPVGRVSRVESGIEAHTAYVQPFVALDRIASVLVVTDREHEELPEGLMARWHGMRPAAVDGVDGSEAEVVAETEADRIKFVYRRVLEAEGTGVGVLSGTGPPDFSEATDSLQALGMGREEND